jgi:hypothetical protein
MFVVRDISCVREALKGWRQVPGVLMLRIEVVMFVSFIKEICCSGDHF